MFYLIETWVFFNPLLDQVGAMAHGKVDDEYVEDYISSKFLPEVTHVF